MNELKSIPRIIKTHEINGYTVSCLFNNGQSRLIDFKRLFTEQFKVNEKHPAYELLHNPTAFEKVKVMDTSLGWEDIGIHSTDEEGKPIFYPYDLDPFVLFQNSVVILK